MERQIYDIFLERYPKKDLHGLDRDSARMYTNDFVYENVILGNDTIILIHGKGEGIVRRACHEALAVNKMVQSYKVDNFNPGITIVNLNLNR